MHRDFDLPGKGRIDGRTSSITAAFFQAITPVTIPSDVEVEEAISILGMTQGNCRCAYCGDPRTEWDHFRPIVVNRKPTGYITEIANLVPACGKCNQSKGNKNWRDWIVSEAKRSPQTRRIPDLDTKIQRLEAYEKWRTPMRIDYAAIIGAEQWTEYCALLDTTVAHLASAQKVAVGLQAIISKSMNLAALPVMIPNAASSGQNFSNDSGTSKDLPTTA